MVEEGGDLGRPAGGEGVGVSGAEVVAVAPLVALFLALDAVAEDETAPAVGSVGGL